jgi:hypothetical protein
MKIYVWVDGTKINGIYNRKFSNNQFELDLTEAQLEYLKQNSLGAYYIDGKVVYKNLDKIAVRQQLEKEQADILQWLTDNDWKVNKIVVGEWTKEDPRWLSYLQERQTKRSRLEEIEDTL